MREKWSYYQNLCIHQCSSPGKLYLSGYQWKKDSKFKKKKEYELKKKKKYELKKKKKKRLKSFIVAMQ